MAKIIKENEFENEVLKKDVALVDFFADWCGPCKIMSPIIDEISNENKNANILKINVDESQELASKYQITSIPAICIFKNGELVKKFIGVTEKEEIEKFL